MFTLFGILVGTILISLGIITGKAPAEVFLNWQGLAIVLGGTIAATFVSYPMPEVARAFRSYFIIFRFGGHDFIRTIDLLVTAVRNFQRDGLQTLAKEVESFPGLWIFKDGVQMMVNGYLQEESRTVLEDQVRWQVAREQKQQQLFASMAKIAPAFGMIGTLIGLINMLITLQSNPGQVGNGLAIALTTTFYGLILSHMVFAPFSEKIRERSENNLMLETMQIETVMMLYEKHNYIYARDKLAAYLAAQNRKKVYALAGNAATSGRQRAGYKRVA